MHGVMLNIKELCAMDHSKVWGPEGWKKIVISIVADGRKIIQPRVLSILAAMGVYQEGLAKNIVDGKPVTAHIYEVSTQFMQAGLLTNWRRLKIVHYPNLIRR